VKLRPAVGRFSTSIMIDDPLLRRPRDRRHGNPPVYPQIPEATLPPIRLVRTVTP
jgi:hypothetical protein